jgi:hypothetical protein
LIEEEYGERPPFGAVVLGDGFAGRGQEHRRKRTSVKVLAIAEKISEHRRTIREEIPVRATGGEVRACGQRAN